MALRAQQLDQLQVSWDGVRLALWAIDGDDLTGQLALRSLAAMAFGYNGLALLGAGVTPLYLPTPGNDIDEPGGRRATYAQSLQPFDQNAYAFMNERHSVAETSTSLRWIYAAADLGLFAARSGLLAPAVSEQPVPENAGLAGEASTRWEGSWRLRHSPELHRAMASLEGQAPPALWAPFARGAPAGAVRDVVEHFADGAARWALETAGWRPDFGRSSRADMVIARRVTAALRAEREVLITNGEQRTVVGGVGLALDEHRASIDAGAGFRCRARLRLPDDPADGNDAETDTDDRIAAGIDDHGEIEEESVPWRVTFEVVLVDDPTITFSWADLASGFVQPGVTPGGVEVSAVGLSTISQHVETLAAKLASEIHEFAELSASAGVVLLDVEDVTRLLADGVERCAALGCALLVPKELARRKVHLRGEAKAEQGGGPSADLGTTMVDVDWGLALGQDRLTDAEIAALAESKSQLVQLRGAWVRVDAGHVTTALEHLSKRRRGAKMTPAELLRLAAIAGRSGDGASGGNAGESIELVTEEDENDRDSADGWLADLLAGLPDDRLTEADEPEGFVGQLRPYQRRAVGWLAFLHRLGLGGCLADDMGLGKTPTTLAHLVGHMGDRPSLVMCPLSVVHNWQAEAAVFAPKLRVLIAHGASRKRGEEFAAQLEEVDLVISTYGTVSRDIEAMAEHRWNIVVCDEAQAIKNHRTKAARAVRALEARQLVALTGTPVENRLTELWSILDAANPGSLGGIGWFRDTFATPIETKSDENALVGMKQLTSPFVLRRTKADKSLVPDLPDKIEQVAWARLTDEQAGLYQAVLDDFLAQASETELDEDSLLQAIEQTEAPQKSGGPSAQSDAMKRRGLVLATLTRLKQICNHPAQFLAAGGEEPGRLKGRSGKLDRFDELVTELLEAEERALIFTQYREMGELLVAHLAQTHEVRAKFLHGGVSRTGRDEMVRNFQSGDSAPLQVVSLKAGGTGLNLTSASRVIHYDRWWNPAVEDQATDRAWRIGQKSTVFVHKLVCRGTMEERIDSLLQDKKALADSAVSSGEGWLTEMSTDELKGLLSLGPNATSEDPL